MIREVLNKMKQIFNTIEFGIVLEELGNFAVTKKAKEQICELEPFLDEKKLKHAQRETTLAKMLLMDNGNPPIPVMENVEEYLEQIGRYELLSAEQMEEMGTFFVAVKRIRKYLEQGEKNNNSIAFYSQNLGEYEKITEQIQHSIRNGRVDDYASKKLNDIRRQLLGNETKIREKAEAALKVNKAYASENFVVSRNGHVCIPIKKEYRSKVQGTVVDMSGAGGTVFMEPKSVSRLCEEQELLLIAQEEEERKILYTLMAEISEQEVQLREDIRVIAMLDFAFAKGKLSLEMEAIEPEINTDGNIRLVQARHPQIEKDRCVPLDFEIGGQVRGVIITGPNTGGKTVAIKTVALLSLMASCGLHVPAKEAIITMHNQILCDIGDGQNMSDNLSTFSAHIKNVIDIMKKVTQDSLVIMDELGSGTDPTEGMGIAIAILEELRKSNALFLVTTHYPEVKTYAERFSEIENASMSFDRESLKPLYRLELGKPGESCALYIAKKLGLSKEMIQMAAKEAYKEKADKLINELMLDAQEEDNRKNDSRKEFAPKIIRESQKTPMLFEGEVYTTGDSVEILPDKEIGIVVKPMNQKGDVLVQIKREKFLINHKRIKLKVKADKLYPENYDFSILFDTVEVRKARHQMDRKYVEDTLYFD